ncbi:MAG: hypothetical protein AB7O29_09035 [Acidimicrobiia bacterium]
MALVVAALSGSPTLAAAHPAPDPPAVDLGDVLVAQAAVSDVWLGADGVVGTGVGRDGGGDPVLVVFVDDADAIVPKTVHGVPTKRVVSDVFSAQSCPAGGTGACSRPTPPGVSAGHKDITAGTLGALVEDAAGHQYALSNNHVFANANAASVGDAILQPGAFDGGTLGDPADLLGTLHDFHPLQFCVSTCGPSSPSNTIDAALAAVSPGIVQRQTLCGWTPAVKTVPPSQLVVGATTLKKCGRTTNHTTGTVVATNVTVVIDYGANGQARFDGQVATTAMSQPGDSGSLMVDAADHPVALLTGGSGTFTVGNPIDVVLARFGVTMDDGIAGPPVGPKPPSCVPPQNSWAASAVTGFSMPAGDGYWVARANGTVTTGGGSGHHGDPSCIPLNGPILGGAGIPEGSGYWLNGQDGGVFTYGTAPFFGSMGGSPLNQPVFSMASTPSGRGYWLVAYDGGIFSFGDAGFHGSTGAIQLTQPIIAITTSPTGGGYRMVARDGGIFSFGDVPYFGSLPGAGVAVDDVVGMAPTPSGQGYWVIRATGHTYAFGDAPYLGQYVAGPGDPVVAVFANPVDVGYRVVLASGNTTGFGVAPG